MPAHLLSLTPLSTHVHTQVLDLHRDAGRTGPPVYPEMGVVMTTDLPGSRQRVVASCYLYPVQAFLFLEFLITNPEFPRRLRYMAVDLGLRAVMAISAARGLLLVAAPRTFGAEKILAKMGFRDSRATMYTLRPPMVPVWMSEDPEAVKKAQPPSPTSAKDMGGGRKTTVRLSKTEKEATASASSKVRARKKAVKRRPAAKKTARRRRKGAE